VSWIEYSVAFWKILLEFSLYYFSGPKSWWMQLSTFLVKFLGCLWLVVSKTSVQQSYKRWEARNRFNKKSKRLCISAWDTGRYTGIACWGGGAGERGCRKAHQGLGTPWRWAWGGRQSGSEKLRRNLCADRSGTSEGQPSCLLWSAAPGALDNTWVCRETGALLRTSVFLWFVAYPWNKC